MGRLAQTLAISVEKSAASKHRCSKVMSTATTSRHGCKYKLLGAFARVGIARLQFRWSAQNVLVSASRQRAAPRSQSTKLRAGARSQVRHRRGSATRRARVSTKTTHSAPGSNKFVRTAAACSKCTLRNHGNSSYKVPSSSPQDGGCFRVLNCYKCALSSLVFIQALLANQSLNRTLCGGPRLAIISFLAKHGPPQSAG